jgi:hypothetical protein
VTGASLGLRIRPEVLHERRAKGYASGATGSAIREESENGKEYYGYYCPTPAKVKSAMLVFRNDLRLSCDSYVNSGKFRVKTR